MNAAKYVTMLLLAALAASLISIANVTGDNRFYALALLPIFALIFWLITWIITNWNN